jgi:hypothetical protein
MTTDDARRAHAEELRFVAPVDDARFLSNHHLH